MSKGTTKSAQTLPPVYPKLRQISERARKDRNLQFNSLAHLVTVDMLGWSFKQLSKDAAKGVDGVTWRSYATDANQHLANLHSRMRNWQYRAQPARRVFIPKEDGQQRPLAVPALEDKIVQKAVATILEAIYEEDFHPHSYGFRPGRSPHHALDRLHEIIRRDRICWIIDADIKSYFDTVVHRNLMEFLRKRIVDGSLLRLVSKWLHAGVLEDGRLLVSDVGTPQGSVISPLLANIYLHYVLDEWWSNEVLPRMSGSAELIRYCDDFVLCFERQEDAERVYRVLGQRFARFGLTLHPDKTRLLRFVKGRAGQKKDDGGQPPTFNFLGFTHYFGKSRSGELTYKVKTMAKRLTRSLKAIGAWCRLHRHDPVPSQWRELNLKLRGHYEYYGRSHNSRSLGQFKFETTKLWHKWLSRRNGRNPLTWDKFNLLLKRFPLLPPRITHRLF